MQVEGNYFRLSEKITGFPNPRLIKGNKIKVGSCKDTIFEEKFPHLNMYTSESATATVSATLKDLIRFDLENDIPLVCGQHAVLYSMIDGEWKMIGWTIVLQKGEPERTKRYLNRCNNK